MTVLMISTDASILNLESESGRRMKEYGALTDKLDIIVCTTRSQGSEDCVISDTVRAYPTNSSSKLWYVWDVLKTAKRVINTKVDLVTSQDPFETGIAGWLLARRLHAKLQLQIHTDFLSPYFRGESLKNRIRVWIAKWLLPKADGIRVVSERIRSSLSSIVRDMSRVVVLPIFVDVEKIKRSPVNTDLRKKYPQFDFILLMTSRLEPEKNIELAINAMKDVVKKNSKAGLIITGEGSLKERLHLRQDAKPQGQ